MRQFESSQKDESRAQSDDTSKGYRKRRAFYCILLVMTKQFITDQTSTFVLRPVIRSKARTLNPVSWKPTPVRSRNAWPGLSEALCFSFSTKITNSVIVFHRASIRLFWDVHHIDIRCYWLATLRSTPTEQLLPRCTSNHDFAKHRKPTWRKRQKSWQEDWLSVKMAIKKN